MREINDCLCDECRERKDFEYYMVRYISEATIYHGLTELVNRDLYEDAVIAYSRRGQRRLEEEDPYEYRMWMYRARKELKQDRLYNDDRFSVLDDGSIVSHLKWIDPTKYGTVVGTYALPRVAEYVAWKVQRQIEKDRKPFYWELFIRTPEKDTPWEYEGNYHSFLDATNRQMMYTFERGEEHDTMLRKYDRHINLIDCNIMEWVYSSESGTHVEERSRRYA